MEMKDCGKFIRVMILIFYDIASAYMASLAAWLVKYGFQVSSINKMYLEASIKFMPFMAVTIIVIFYIFRLYNSLWVYASIREMFNIICASFIISVLYAVVMIQTGRLMPDLYFFLFGVFFLCLNAAGRFFYRFLRAARHIMQEKMKSAPTRIMLIGAGNAGQMIVKEVHYSKYVHAKVVCAIDDDTYKQGKYIKGVPIIGGRQKITDAVKEYDVNQIVLAMPSVSVAQQREILNICKETGCDLKILPGIYQFLNDEVRFTKLRDVQIEDLMGREQINFDKDSISSYVKDKVVLVTGGGGSIGSELCRQIVSHHPRLLIILDIYENTTYDLQQELKRTYPELKMEVLIGSVRNTHRVNQIFEQYHPDIVFHAAAHKHVPLMEDSPNEAIKNNVYGTLNCARAANTYGTKRFVLISTDKAVNPTNIMGATKRICEMIIQSMARISMGTEYVAVRFGNVLGSNGSVVLLFKKQIESGGPVTVTHKDVVRFFMTIPEAVSLVLQAGAFAKGGEIFVLDMGEPVRIDDLARNMIKLAGMKPDEDIRIVYTGLRPGEKLYEEMLLDEEGLRKTENKMIYIAKPIQFDDTKFLQELDELKQRAYEDNGMGRKIVQKMVPTYQYPTMDSCIAERE